MYHVEVACHCQKSQKHSKEPYIYTFPWWGRGSGVKKCQTCSCLVPCPQDLEDFEEAGDALADSCVEAIQSSLWVGHRIVQHTVILWPANTKRLVHQVNFERVIQVFNEWNCRKTSTFLIHNMLWLCVEALPDEEVAPKAKKARSFQKWGLAKFSKRVFYIYYIYYHSCIIKYIYINLYISIHLYFLIDLYILYIYCVCAQLRTPFSLRTPFKGKFVYICCIWFAVKNNNIIWAHMHACIYSNQCPSHPLQFLDFPLSLWAGDHCRDQGMQALSAMLRRLCRPKESSGRLEVSPEIHKQWAAGGDQRKALLDILIKTNGNKAGFKKQHANNQLKNERFR